tara:strand:+ start:487 stop:630 length:144 start_codon:yes stop_codon:yes gene_type:complete
MPYGKGTYGGKRGRPSGSKRKGRIIKVIKKNGFKGVSPGMGGRKAAK